MNAFKIPTTSLLIAGALALTACGGDDDTTDATAAPVAASAAPATAAAPSTDAPSTDAPSTDAPSTDAPSTDAPSTDAPSTDAPSTDAASAPSGDAIVGVGPTELGDVLVDANGLTLYAFLNDTGGTSACYDACAQAWPPLIVDGPDVPAGLDAEVFSVTERDDGTHQLVAGDWPLYTYFEDGAPGDVFGQGVGAAWYVVDPTGELNQATPGAPVGSDADSSGYGY